MKRPGPATRFATALAAASLLVSSAASAAPVRAVDHVVSASLVSASAQAAVCTTAIGSAAAAQAAPAQPGCVIPVVDAAPTPGVETAPPAVYVPPAEGGGSIGILPLLLGLAAVAGLAWLLVDDDNDDDEIRLPVSRA